MIAIDLSGKRALITGAASGIGLETARMFARNGATVALNDLPDNPKLLDEVSNLKRDGLDVHAAPGDVGERASCDSMVRQSIDTLSGLDFLINNAGTPATKRPVDPTDLDALGDDTWSRILSVNLTGAYRCTRTAVNALREGRGSVVNTCSVAGLTGVGSSTAYAASKAGLINLTKALAKALAPEIRVNAVAPGVVESPWECQWPEDEQEQRLARIPLQRPGYPVDFAEAILFLAASGSYITGHTLVVDGGMIA